MLCECDSWLYSTMWAPATKENRKGQTRSYNYRRKLIVAVFILISAAILIWRFLAYTQKSTELFGSGKVGTMDDRPIRNIEYGVQNTPLVMIKSSLEDELLQRFLQEHLYSCSEKELNNIPELDNRVKPPVYVYEGHYHSLATSEPVYSKNPNPLIGADFDKPAASPFTRAFYDAFRVVNREIFDRLKENLIAASSYNHTMEGDVCYLAAKWIDESKHFGALSIQIHYGKNNDAKLASGVAWHTDAENSLLHLAVTLRGNRVLHSRRIQANTKNSTLRQPKSNQQQPIEVLEKQQPGSTYLSSSTLMRHAPQFFDTDYSTRSIAIHARLLYTSAEIDHFRRIRTRDSWERLTNVLANVLAAAHLQIPSLAQVESRLLLQS